MATAGGARVVRLDSREAAHAWLVEGRRRLERLRIHLGHSPRKVQPHGEAGVDQDDETGEERDPAEPEVGLFVGFDLHVTTGRAS